MTKDGEKEEYPGRRLASVVRDTCKAREEESVEVCSGCATWNGFSRMDFRGWIFEEVGDGAIGLWDL